MSLVMLDRPAAWAPLLSASRRLRILFIGEAVSLAHVARPLVLAQALDARRHEILFACGSAYRKFAHAAGFRVQELPTLAPEIFMLRLASGAPLYDRRTLETYVAAERELFESFQPDLIVGDFRVSLSISAERAGIPYVSLCNAHWSPYSVQRFPVPELPLTRILGPAMAGWVVRRTEKWAFQYHARAYNAVRVAQSLEPVPDLREMYTRGTWTFYLDTPGVAPTVSLPKHHRYLGPVVWSPQDCMPCDWTAGPSSRALVYVTLGSSGDTRVLQDLLAVLGRMPVRVALATAGRPVPKSIPSNVCVATYLPAPEVLRQAALCVFNGGAGTGYQALEAGVPVLGFPSNADQFFHMESVVRAGAGLLLRPSSARVGRIAEALATLLREPSFRAAAGRLRREVAEYPAAARFRHFVEVEFWNGRVALEPPPHALGAPGLTLRTEPKPWAARSGHHARHKQGLMDILFPSPLAGRVRGWVAGRRTSHARTRRTRDIRIGPRALRGTPALSRFAGAAGDPRRRGERSGHLGH